MTENISVMDTGKFTCNVCGGKIRTDLDMVGDTIECPHCANSIMVPLTGMTAGMQVSHYVLKSRVGMGAMGEVWMAVDPSNERRVALKILSPALTRDQIFIERFRREVAIVASLAHPNIITAFDAGVDRDIHFLAINYVDGSNLEKMLDDGVKFGESETLAIGLMVANALKYVWDSKRIVHRDIKPSNIMVDNQGVVYLMDLGVSRSVTRKKSNITNTDQFVGTPHFMSPEQARSRTDIDFSSDIYSLGCTLYNLIARRPPFDADSNVELLNKHIHEPPLPASTYNPSVSRPFDELLHIMMSKDKSDRQTSWAEVVSDITKVMERDMPGKARASVRKGYGDHSSLHAGATEITEVVETKKRRRTALPILDDSPATYLLMGAGAGLIFLIVWWIFLGF